MRKSKLDPLKSRRFLQILLLSAALIYSLLLLFFRFPSISSSPSAASGGGSALHDRLLSQQDDDSVSASGSPFRPYRLIKSSVSSQPPSGRARRAPLYVSSLKFADLEGSRTSRNLSELQKSAKEAFRIGGKLFNDLDSVTSASAAAVNQSKEEEETKCPHSVTLSGEEFKAKGGVMVIPCGLTLGSHITVVGRPHKAHPEADPKIAILREGDEPVMVSQFMMELQGLKTVDGEDPPRILHFNPRLKGDWSGTPVIEQNTCYRMQWGTALRCEGWKSRADEETGNDS